MRAAVRTAASRGGAARHAGENRLAGDDPAGHGDRLLALDHLLNIDLRGVVDVGYDRLLHIFQTLDVVPARRLGADHLDVGLHRLQKTRQPHERSRRAEGTDQIVDLAARLLPDFERRRLIVRQVVAGVGELIGHEIAVGVRRYGRARITDRPVGPLLGRSENHLGAVGADDLAPFDRHGLRHDDLHGIPLDDSTIARPMPVLPDVGSMMVLPGVSLPSRSASSIILDRNAVLGCCP